MRAPKTPLLTVDCVVVNSDGCVLMIRRKNPPYRGQFALPGGFVDVGETVESAARRELFEETTVRPRKLTLIGVYSDPRRDPRGHTCSVAFWAKVGRAKAMAGDDAASVAWVANPLRAKIAFDHRKIVADALRLMKKSN